MVMMMVMMTTHIFGGSDQRFPQCIEYFLRSHQTWVKIRYDFFIHMVVVVMNDNDENGGDDGGENDEICVHSMRVCLS